MPKGKSEQHDFASIKCPLSKIIRDPNDIALIEDVVIRENKLIINLYQFIKLYLLHLLERDEDFPKIDDDFVLTCSTILKTSNKSNTSNKSLQDFYNNYYVYCNPNKVHGEYLRQITGYEATKIVTAITNNIEAQYIKRINQFFNKVFGLKETLKEIKKMNCSDAQKKQMRSECYSIVRQIKNDFYDLSGKNRESSINDLNWLALIKDLLVPNKESFEMNSITYDLKANPLDYLPCLMNLNKLYEEAGFKLFHSFPLRSDIKPKYIRIDTATIMELFIPPEGISITNEEGTQIRKKTECKTMVTVLKYDVWKEYFKLEMKCFKKKGYNFHGMIETDGVGASIIMSKPKNGKKNQTEEEDEFCYIDKISITPQLQNKQVVGIDPGKSDIIYCIDNTRQTFRYTANQRRFETQSKKYNKYLYLGKLNVNIDGFTPIEYETELADYNSKSCNFQDVQEYIYAKTYVNNKLFKFYQEGNCRRFRFNRYSNTQRSEANMVNNFKKIYGDPSQTIIAFGDHTQGGHQMKHLEPTKDIGIRRLFKKAGYQVYLVDEFRTSLKCHKCKSDTKKFKYEISKKPKSLGKIKLVHGLIRCKNAHCGIKWNRDYNGSLNILEIAKAALEEKGRPEAFVKNSGPGRG